MSNLFTPADRFDPGSESDTVLRVVTA